MSLNRRQLTPRQVRKQLERQCSRGGRRVKIVGSAKGLAHLLGGRRHRLTTHARPLPSISIPLFCPGVTMEQLATALGIPVASVQRVADDIDEQFILGGNPNAPPPRGILSAGS